MDNIVKKYSTDKKIKFSANITRVSVYSALIWCIVAVLLTSILRDMLFSYINWFFGGTLLVLLTFILAKSKRRVILFKLFWSQQSIKNSIQLSQFIESLISLEIS